MAVSVRGGDTTPERLPPVDPQQDPGPVIDPAATAIASATAAATSINYGGSLVLDGSTSTGATSYKWTQMVGASVTLSSNTSAKPTHSMPFFAKASDTVSAVVPAAAPIRMRMVVTSAAGTASAPATVELSLVTDTVSISAGAKHCLGTEFRIDGTSAEPGATGLPAQGTTVNIYNTTSGTPVPKLGTTVVGATNNWQLKIKPGPNRQITSVMVWFTRGGVANTSVANRCARRRADTFCSAVAGMHLPATAENLCAPWVAGPIQGVP